MDDDKILEVLAAEPMKPSEICRALGKDPKAKVSRDPRAKVYVTVVSEALQKFKAAGKVVLKAGRWSTTGTQVMRVQLPLGEVPSLRVWLMQIGGKELS